MSLIWGGMFLLLLVELAVTVMLLVPMPEKVRAFLARSLRAIYHMKHVKFVFSRHYHVSQCSLRNTPHLTGTLAARRSRS